MKILAIRTDKPKAELYVYNGQDKLAEHHWEAHLKLAETLNSEIEKILNKSSIAYEQLNGFAIFKGPGSFTGLRIGMSVANALAYAYGIPIVAESGDDWLKKSIERLEEGQDDRLAVPEYGAEPHVTRPRK